MSCTQRCGRLRALCTPLFACFRRPTQARNKVGNFNSVSKSRVSCQPHLHILAQPIHCRGVAQRTLPLLPGLLLLGREGSGGERPRPWAAARQGGLWPRLPRCCRCLITVRGCLLLWLLRLLRLRVERILRRGLAIAWPRCGSGWRVGRARGCGCCGWLRWHEAQGWLVAQQHAGGEPACAAEQQGVYFN